jgi:translocation and assembly module TamB
LEERLPFVARSLEGELKAEGSLHSPTARLDAKVLELNWQGNERVTPINVRDLQINASIAKDTISLEGLSLRLEEYETVHTVTGSISRIDWTTWLKTPSPELWIDLAAEIKMEEWPVAALGRLLPPQIDTDGTLSIALTKEKGNWPEGVVKIQDISSRPLGEGLVARQISGEAHFKGKKVENLLLTGTIGNQPWQLEGWLDGTNKGYPRFHFDFEAERLDLLRRSDLILRGQAKLTADNDDSNTPPKLSGEINMLRSLWLQNLQDFTRQGAAGVARRPPYFSIDWEPLSGWELDVKLYGDDFLQIRTTVLTGAASAEFDLGGTLGEPILSGEAWVNDGSILFPFARLPATELRGRITIEEPHSVKLTGSGEGVAYGYIIRYELSGTAEDPTIQFSSIPSLAQDQILLMVATGAVPSTDSSTSANERAGRLALYLGQDFFSELLGQEGASRLEIRSGEGFSPFSRDGQVIEYKLNEIWSVLGEYDNFGGYNVDLKRKLLK